MPIGFRSVQVNVLALTASVGISTAVYAQDASAPWIKTKEPITILSANDGQYHLKLNAQMQIDREKPTRDSVTVVRLSADAPPVVRTIWDVPNSIAGSPYIAMTGDGRYGFVPSVGGLAFFGKPDAQTLTVIDLSGDEPKVAQKLEDVPLGSNMLLMHPDGKRLIVATKTGFSVFEMKADKLTLVKENNLGFNPGSFDITRSGDRMVVSFTKGPFGPNTKTEMHMLSYKDGVIADLGEIKVKQGVAGFASPFSFRFTPDGKRIVIPNAGGIGSKGTLDNVLIVDASTNPAMVVEEVPQVADGIESMAVHPSGRFAVMTAIDEQPNASHIAYGHLNLIDLTTHPARRLYDITVEPVGEGVEFTPDGTQLFVQFTNANHIAAFDVDGMMLKRSPFDMRVGPAPSSMALGRSFKK